MFVGFDVFFVHPAKHLDIGPSGITKNGGNKNDCRNQHHTESILRGGCIPDRQAVSRIQAGWHDERKHTETSGQYDARHRQ